MKPKLGLIIPLPEEYRHVADLLGPTTDDPKGPRGGRTYLKFKVRGSDITGVLLILHNMGLPSASAAMENMLSNFPVDLVALVGVGASLSKEVSLGDVVVASEIVSYLHAARASEGLSGAFPFEQAGTSWKPPARVLNFVNNFSITNATNQLAVDWSERCLDQCSILAPAKPEDGPEYHVGPVASGDIVGASLEFQRAIKKINRKLFALEMEAGGAALAAYESGDADLLVLRGISDHANHQKKDTDATIDADGRPNAWRRYALRNAVELLLSMVGSPHFPWRSSHNGPSPLGIAAAAAGTTGLIAGAATHAFWTHQTTPAPPELVSNILPHTPEHPQGDHPTPEPPHTIGSETGGELASHGDTIDLPISIDHHTVE
jgi:nucleoside phosphorylase